jgi:hypothetical protein
MKKDRLNTMEAIPFTLPQIEIIEQRRAELLSGANKGIDWKTMHDSIRKSRQAASGK